MYGICAVFIRFYIVLLFNSVLLEISFSEASDTRVVSGALENVKAKKSKKRRLRKRNA